MSHTPHELAADFPEYVDRIHHLKLTDANFRLQMDEYHEVNRAVHRMETFVEPVCPDTEADLRRRRVALKDALYRLLSEPA